MPRLMVIAAEASADVHAAAVVRELMKEIPGIEAFGMAGPSLREAGVEAVARTEEVSVMGFTEVIPALPRILGVMGRLERAARSARPDLLLLVDSPDLNLRMAARLRRLGMPILYYIAPMVWAWRRGRIGQVARLVDKLCVILPFEERIWKEGGVDVAYVGNPLLDARRRGRFGCGDRAVRASLGLDAGKLTIALLPGSREMEIRRCLASMVEAAGLLAAAGDDPLQCVVPVAPTIAPGDVREAASAASADVPVHLSTKAVADVLPAADVAVVASGTAALEAALAGLPMVVVYKVSWGTWLGGRLLVRTPFVSLPNLLAGREVVPELLQARMTPERIAEELSRVLPGRPGRETMLRDLEAIVRDMGEAGAARRVALEATALMSDGAPSPIAADGTRA